MSRIDAREKAMQLLYQLESQPGDTDEQISFFLDQRTPLSPDRTDWEAADSPDAEPFAPLAKAEPADQASDDLTSTGDEEGRAALRQLTEKDRRYLVELVRGVLQVAPVLDGLYGPYLVKWTPERLPRLERILLRMGTYEIVYDQDIPDSVAINEIIRLTRQYADEEAYAYINAVLGKVSRTHSNLRDDAMSELSSEDGTLEPPANDSAGIEAGDEH